MRICLYLDPSRVFRWHVWLAGALTAIPGYQVFPTFASGSCPLPRSCLLLFEFERLIYGVKKGNAVDPAADLMRVPPGAASGKPHFDALVDFTGHENQLPPHQRILTPVFNGIPGEVGVITALTTGQCPVVEVHDSAYPGKPWTARPAVVDRDVFLIGLDNTLSCAVRLIAKALADPPVVFQSAAIGCAPAHLPLTEGPVGVAAFARATRSVGRKMLRLLDRFVRGGRGWSIAWRFDCASSLLDRGQARFSVVAAGTGRYFADPFPFCRNGRNFIFAEEVPYATGRGCISVFEIERDGSVSAPRMILDEPHHLSYPFVFEHAGEVWMIPESGEVQGVFLYRAEQFPLKWRREACLISGIEAFDSTLLNRDGRLWLFVCERAWGSSSWDMLTLFHAEELTGDWLPHSRNPILLDATLSRPAGAVFTHDGRTLRPVQDCTRQYGGAVILCRLDALDRQEFRQTAVGQIHCGRYGCHTYNRHHAGLEVIDIFGPTSGLRHVTAGVAPMAPIEAPCPTTASVSGDRQNPLDVPRPAAREA